MSNYDWIISKEHTFGLVKAILPWLLAVASAILTVAITLGEASPWFRRTLFSALAVYGVALVFSILVWHLDRSIHGDLAVDGAKLTALKKAVLSSLVVWADRLKDDISESANVRITIYGYDKTTDVFIPVIRRCRNPDLQALHRNSYPRAEGLIAKVWQSGSGRFECLAKKDLQKRLRQQHLEETGIPGEAYDELLMKPFSMIGVALARGDETCGVVIVESDSQDVNIAGGLDKLKRHPRVEDVARVISETKGLLSDLRDDQEYNTHIKVESAGSPG